jgi:carboxylate-amine ligase
LFLTQLTFATHVHVGMPSGNTAIFVMRYLTPCLPVLLAVAANSPYWRGYETGYAGYRSCILAASEKYGLPDYFEDWADFVRFYRAAHRSGIWGQFKDIHWDLRPRPDYGTLELRVMDAASTVGNATALAAFVRCLMIYFIEHVSMDIDECLPSPLPHWLEHINRYRASHLGLDADYVCDKSGHTRPLRALISDLIDLIRPIAKRVGEEQGIERFESLIAHGAGYATQRQVYEETNSMVEVTRQLVVDLSQEVNDVIRPEAAGPASGVNDQPGSTFGVPKGS